MKSILLVFFFAIVSCSATKQYKEELGEQLFDAILFSRVQDVQKLLDDGANPNTCLQYNFHPDKRTALELAFHDSRNKDIIELLIEHGADVNKNDVFGLAHIFQAITRGHKRILEMLIEKGANVNAISNYREMTPLHYIVMYDSDRDDIFISPERRSWTDDDYLKYAELLINHGANLYAKAEYPKDGDSHTPLDIAKTSKMRKLLGSKMGLWEWLKTRW